MSDDLYLKVWRDAVDAATGEPAIKFKPAANNAAAAILRERFIPRVTGPHDGLIEELLQAVKDEEDPTVMQDYYQAGHLCNAAAALASLQAELAEAREALRLNMDRAHNEAKEAKLWFHKAQEWRDALERIATVDMGGGFLGAQACRAVARKALGDKQ